MAIRSGQGEAKVVEEDSKWEGAEVECNEIRHLVSSVQSREE
jgi:hypothetical protein